MSKWKPLSDPNLVYEGWRQVYSQKYELPNGARADFEYGDSRDRIAVAVIALTREKEVILARQFRVGPSRVMDELPGGVVDEGEDPRSAAARELLEETGYIPASIEYLGKVYKHAWLGTHWEYYIAYDCDLSAVGQQLEQTEAVEVTIVPIGQLFENARNANMTDTEAVFLAYDRLKEIQGEHNEATN